MAEWQERIFGSRALDFRIGDRWQYTATDGYTGSPGNPITLTYSFVPDGINVDGATNQLHSRLNSQFGSQEVWQQLVARIFQRWSDVSGIHYLLVSDDGAGWGSNGQLGSRGDIRIASIPIDGPSNVLAYDYFPDQGDMVLDADENWGATQGDYIFFRNIVAHEHGHGWGLNHVCPANSTKLLEPYYSPSFDGPQHDDIRAAIRDYGDRYDLNNTAGTSSDLGILDHDTTITEIGIQSLNDQDWWYFEIPDGFGFNLTIRPVGHEYLEGPQNGDGSCTAGTLINSLDDVNLNLSLYDATGTILLGQSADHPAGEDERIARFDPPPGGGAYQANVIGTQTDNVQLYDLIFDTYDLDDPYLSVIPLDFDTTNVGTPVTLQTKLYNNAATELSVTAISISTPFTVEPQAPLTIPGGGNVDLFVTFPAPGLGAYPGTLTIHHSGPSGVIECPLSAVAVDAWLNFVTTSVAEFGELPVGSMDSVRIPVRAMGNVPLTLLAFAAPPPFSIRQEVPYSLLPTQTLFLYPRFAPTEVGEFGGDLIITHSGSSSPDTITLHGVGTPVSVDDVAGELPSEFRLYPNYPNPFNPATRIAFDLPRASEVNLDVFDVNGRLVRELRPGNLAAGSHTVEFNGANLPSGVYLYRFSAGGFEGFGKMMLLK
ncbi:MAG: choice-of-anchor D domain-containing protein [bacterium]|nr:choice-of-anchor D domain-containing protein [bacterium]